MKKENYGVHTKALVTNLPIDKESPKYKEYKKNIPHFLGQAVYVYSLKENRLIYASGWKDLLGYEDEEMNLLTYVSITTPKYYKFSNELNDKALLFLKTKSENLEEYSFTLELEKYHKDGRIIPLHSRIGIFKATNGKVEEIIGVSQTIKGLKFGDVMQFSAYGRVLSGSEFEETLSEAMFQHFVISGKEKEALELAANGYAFKEIANKLNVSQSAIEKRILPMYKRFNVKSLPHLISFAFSNHIL